jgi:hypothetical protein
MSFQSNRSCQHSNTHKLREDFSANISVGFVPRTCPVVNTGGAELFGFEIIETIGTAGTIGTAFFLGVFKAMEGLNPQVKQKTLSDNPKRFYGI